MTRKLRTHWIYGVKQGTGIGAFFTIEIGDEGITGRMFDATLKDWRARETLPAADLFALDPASPLLRDAVKFRYRLKIATPPRDPVEC